MQECQSWHHQGLLELSLSFFIYDLLGCAEHKISSPCFEGFFPRMFLVQVVVLGLEPSLFSLFSRLCFVTASVRSWHSDYHHWYHSFLFNTFFKSCQCKLFLLVCYSNHSQICTFEVLYSANTLTGSFWCILAHSCKIVSPRRWLVFYYI